MKRMVLSILSVGVLSLGLAATAHAGLNAGGVMFFHTDNSLEYTTDVDDYTGMSGNPCDPNFGGTCPPPDPACGCEWVLNGAVTASTKAENEASVVWLMAAFPSDACPAVSGAVFGITWVGADAILIGDSGNAGDLEISQAGWPGRELGNAITFSSPKKSTLVELYWFAIYQYYQTTLSVRGNVPQGNVIQFGDNQSPSQVDNVTSTGTLGFLGAPGSLPVIGTCGPIPTHETSWGQIKSAFGR